MVNYRVDRPARGKGKGKETAPAEILDRQPPYNAQAEMSVLGSILLKPDTCDEVALVLRPEDFYDDAHAKLYECMLGMHDAGRKIDITLLVDELKRRSLYEKLGGAQFLASIGDAVPTAAHVQHYANIVRTDATSRALIDASTEILRDAYLPI